MLKRFTVPSLCIALMMAIVAGCSNETSVDPSLELQAPPLPSLSTMAIDLSFFDGAGIDPQAVSTGDLDRNLLASTQGLKTNFLNAAVRVLFLDVIVYSAVAQPVAAFALAVHSIPQPQDDGSWLWTYIFVENGNEYAIFLYGTPQDTHVDWRMEVSSDDPAMILDHFTWFEGEACKDDSHGYWQFYEPSGIETEGSFAALRSFDTPGTSSIRIDWENVSHSENRLVLLLNKEGDPAQGSTLTFHNSTAGGSVEFFDASSAATGSIIWRADGSGTIAWPDYNGGVPDCWDVRQDNTECR